MVVLPILASCSCVRRPACTGLRREMFSCVRLPRRRAEAFMECAAATPRFRQLRTDDPDTQPGRARRSRLSDPGRTWQETEQSNTGVPADDLPEKPNRAAKPYRAAPV